MIPGFIGPGFYVLRLQNENGIWRNALGAFDNAIPLRRDKSRKPPGKMF
jgi:hypothetical protein